MNTWTRNQRDLVALRGLRMSPIGSAYVSAGRWAHNVTLWSSLERECANDYDCGCTGSEPCEEHVMELLS